MATPDEVYWFFRKNVKYSSLLIYGLALIDEFVLDEAHLFNGLMLRNFQHLWRRIRTLANSIGKDPRLHILTATPTIALRSLNGAEEIRGQSKCRDVQVELCLAENGGREAQFEKAVDGLLVGGRKILVVCNSARAAHRLFEKHRVDDASTIPAEYRLKFGRAKLGELSAWLEQAGLAKELVDELSRRLLRDEKLALADVPNGTDLKLSLQDVVMRATEVLERQCWLVKRSLWDQSQRPGETWETCLDNRPLPCRIVAALRERLDHAGGPEERQTMVDAWLTDVSERLGNIANDPVHCRAPEFVEITEALISVGLERDLALLLTKRLTFEIRADPGQLPARSLRDRPVYLRSLERGLGEEKIRTIREAVTAGLTSGELKADCRHIGLWKDTHVPVIVYSGSMAKPAREGLINAFSDLERAVLISTSAVEVGVDFHADALVTEECEGNSFLQRFGRVGRHAGGARVTVFVSGDTYSQLGELDRARVSRREFSTKVVDTFPQRNYTTSSKMLDAHHHLMNLQLGRIGRRLNDWPDLVGAETLATLLRRADLSLGFGLRSTMPQISLRDGVTKHPFDLLHYVDDKDLRATDSPFEVAQARIWFTSLLFHPRDFDVVVDLEESLRQSQHLFVLHGGQVHLISGRGIGMRHVDKLADAKHLPWSEKQSLFFILLHGDVYLSRLDRGLGMPVAEAIKDGDGNRLSIPNQTYLVLLGWTDADKTRELLASAGAANREELLYDWDRLKSPGAWAMVILEEATGACFAAYRDLVDYVSRAV